MIDFHAHIDLYPDPFEVAKECSLQQIYVLSVTTTPSAWKGSSALAVPESRIRTALGLHPQIAHERKNELELFDTYLPEARYIGEVGLDGAPEFKTHWNDQLLVFDHILQACSRAGGRIISIHSRRATTEVLSRLAKFSHAGTPILHWFSGSRRELDIAISQGCWFSVGPAMLMSDKARSLVSHMPRDHILTETDGPFAQIDGRSAMPWDAQRATVQLAELWNISVQETQQLLYENLRRLVSSQ
jgi:TatD DNase family protein